MEQNVSVSKLAFQYHNSGYHCAEAVSEAFMELYGKRMAGFSVISPIFSNVKDVGSYFEEQLETLLDLPIVGDVRGLKMMMCVELVKDKTSKESFPDELDIGKLVSDQAEARGLIVRPMGDLNVMSPPLILTHEHVDFIVDTLRECIVAVQEDL